MSSKAKPTLLIDADLIVYRNCAANERDEREGEYRHVLYSNFDEVWPNVVGDMEALFMRFGTEKHVAALSQGRIFRYSVDPTYKGNRVSTRKPLCFWRVREELEKQYRVIKFDGLEADDVCGILATRDPNTIICSEDKDLKSIPGTLYRQGELTTTSKEEADRFFFMQVLMGDATDGYSGCPGVGEVAAKAFLDNPCVLVPYEHEMKSGPRKGEVETRWRQEPTTDLWAGVVSHYVAAGLTEADALKQARLARILRDSDWDRKAKKPILWSPA